jgi:glycosyltransferase involved in cell wall biosynthesis
MLKIGIDIFNLDHNYYGGTSTYSHGIIDGFLKLKKKIRLQIYINENYKKRVLEYKKFNNVEIIVIKKKYKFLEKILNRSFIFLFFFFGKKTNLIDYFVKNLVFKNFKNTVDLKSDILICPSTNLSCYNLKVKTLVNLHDIQHIHYPKYFSKNEVARRKVVYWNTALYAYKIFLSSKFIKKDIINYFKFLKNKNVSVINEGVQLDVFSRKIEILKEKNYVFFPAQLWPHKNHSLVLKAMNILLKKYNSNVKLILTGQKIINKFGVYKDLIKNKNILYLGVVTKKKIVSLFQNSLATLCPSLYESSSLTMLEAIACNTHVIASNTKFNLEMKDYFNIFFFKKNSPSDLAYQIDHLSKNIKLYKNKKKRNIKNIKKFEWKIIATKLYHKIKSFDN